VNHYKAILADFEKKSAGTTRGDSTPKQMESIGKPVTINLSSGKSILLTYEEAWGKLDPETGLREAHKDYLEEIYPEDSYLWLRLSELTETELNNPELCAAIKTVRLRGTRLKRSEKWGFVMEPAIEEGLGYWSSRKEYEKACSIILDPYRRDLIKLLKLLSEVVWRGSS